MATMSTATGGVQEEGAQRPWWRRVFGVNEGGGRW
jgi:hypothetical protein